MYRLERRKVIMFFFYFRLYRCYFFRFIGVGVGGRKLEFYIFEFKFNVVIFCVF